MEARLLDALSLLGASRVEARLLAVLLPSEGLCTSEIIAGTGLRQPEVSSGMKSLVEKGWVTVQQTRPEGKGRPMHAYRLRVPVAVVGRQFEDSGLRRLAQYEEALRVLRSYF